jgi:hypothetical protein
LVDGGASLVANCGYGHGFSVREVLDAARRVTGVAFPIAEGPRRAGDPAILVADSRRLQTLLGWAPRHDDLDYILATAWRWEQRLLAGARGAKGDAGTPIFPLRNAQAAIRSASRAQDPIEETHDVVENRRPAGKRVGQA